MDPALAALIGTVAGAVLGFGGNYTVQRSQRADDKRVREAIADEARTNSERERVIALADAYAAGARAHVTLFRRYRRVLLHPETSASHSGEWLTHDELSDATEAEKRLWRVRYEAEAYQRSAALIDAMDTASLAQTVMIEALSNVEQVAPEYMLVQVNHGYEASAYVTDAAGWIVQSLADPTASMLATAGYRAKVETLSAKVADQPALPAATDATS